MEDTRTQEVLPAARPNEGHVARHPSPREYVRIGIVLALVTACEVTVYYLDAVRNFLVPLLLFFAGIKLSLVVLWYMHLKFDSRTYARFFMIGVAGALTLFMIVLLTFKAFA